ncbi:hypothetical protein Tco_1236737 [Tanacetum coccineum]
MASKNLMQMSADIVKLDRFDGGSFKRWQKKMQFLLATLNVAYVLTKPYPEESKDKTLAAFRACFKFENDDFILSGTLEWNALEERYFIEDATTNNDTSKVHVVEEKGESSKAGGKKRRHDDKDKKKSKKKKMMSSATTTKSQDISSRNGAR